MKKLLLTGTMVFILFNAFTQSVGVGTTSPQAPLHVKTSGLEVLRLEGSGTPSLSIYDNGSYRGSVVARTTNLELYSPLPIMIAPGFVTSATFLGNGNVGLGVAVPTSKLDVGGDINVTGAVRIAGNGGTTGQVLTSNGSGAPVWRTASLPNTRFSATLPSASGDGFMNFTTIYNTNTADITNAGNSIAINRTGIYHIEGSIQSDATFAAAPAFLPRLAFSLQVTSPTTSPAIYTLMYGALTTQINSTQYLKTEKFSTELYLLAGSSFYLSRAYSGGFTASTQGWTTCYLVSE